MRTLWPRRRPAMERLLRACALGLALGGAAAPAALAQGAPTSPAEAEFRATTLNLSAYGQVKLAPDMATISLGVTTQASTAQAAMQANAARMSQVMAALRTGGVAAKDIQTAQLSL